MALFATLFATGVPVLHAWAHEAVQGHDRAAAGPVAEHAHPEVHPAALHDDGLLTHRAAVELELAPPVSPLAVDSAARPGAPIVRPVPAVSSRAPPGRDRARAPPPA